jgi:branched-chain amino acid transport system permease protein
MSATTTRTTTSSTDAATTRDPLDLKRAARIGLITAVAIAFVCLIGMVETFQRRQIVVDMISMSNVLFFGLPFLAGALAGAPPARPGQAAYVGGVRDLVSGAVAGAIASLGPIVLLLGLRTVDLRATFPSASPGLERLLSFGQEGAASYLVLLLVVTVGAVVGSAFRLIAERPRRALVIGLEVVFVLALIELIARQVLNNVGLGSLHRVTWVTNSGLRPLAALVLLVLVTALGYTIVGRRATARERMLAEPLVGESDTRKRRRLIGQIAAVLALAILPIFLGGQLNELLVNVGFYMLLALGLNIIVGYAGLLDLGHVTFFGVGAYSMAVLTSPAAPGFSPGLTWWVALPIVVALAAAAGIFVGTPVIRLRGDYLAIVTLGFAAILERLLISDWLRPTFGGAQGIQRIPGIPFFGTQIRGTDPRGMFYMTLIFVLIAIYVSWRLQESRIGRAWAALREDETTAQAMGVDTTKVKLLAFVTGAMIASFAGALFAAKVGTVYPNSFELLISIIILVVVIVGGMGHIPGVLTGAVVLIGVLGGPRLPGLLQEFENYKMLIYGALLVYMMLQRPEGLVPSVRRSRELHQEEFLQDAWFDKKGKFIDDEGTVDATTGAGVVDGGEGTETR